ncbi:hypothetical protein F2Q69_00005871 [Brassica cretica]|uniref:Uncharacterized protein n=1 Tax=Brassica cretica TaxID=69181 RepID=A0A8S9P2N8_BRACR|nr:hypothetical protein F2Q69_00005871 [Brassica cretica]
MIISYSRISRKTFTERKIRSERTSKSRTKATRRRAEQSRGSARRRAQPSRLSARRRAQPSRLSARQRAEPSCGCTCPASSAIAPVSSHGELSHRAGQLAGELNRLVVVFAGEFAVTRVG